MTDVPEPAPWDRALGYALTGRDHPDWPDTAAPDPARLIGLLAAAGLGPDQLRSHRSAARDRGEPWPHPRPPALGHPIGAAQFAAALGELRRRLGLDRAAGAPVVSGRAPDADEQRLLRDVPPHHGV